MLLCETTTAFVRILAAKATGLPIEFFKLAPRSVSRRIYGMVMGVHECGQQHREPHYAAGKSPTTLRGKQYTEIDLNGVADLNSLNESAAENRLTRAGFMVTDTSYNYLYACIPCRNGNGLAGGVLYRAAAVRSAEN